MKKIGSIMIIISWIWMLIMANISYNNFNNINYFNSSISNNNKSEKKYSLNKFYQANRFNIIAQNQTKPLIVVTESGTPHPIILNPIWFQKYPNEDLKQPSLISEAYMSLSDLTITINQESQTALIYGINNNFEKTIAHPITVNNKSSVTISANLLEAENGLFEIDTSIGKNTAIYYLQISSIPTITNFFDTPQGQYFLDWSYRNNITPDQILHLINIDDIEDFNNLIIKSMWWMPIATYQEYANMLEYEVTSSCRIVNSAGGLDSEDLKTLIFNSLASSVSILGEDTSYYDNNNVKIIVSEPFNKTYQDSEEVIYVISYHQTMSLDQEKLIIQPYTSPDNSSFQNYMWIIVLIVVTLFVVALFIFVYHFWIKKALFGKKK